MVDRLFHCVVTWLAPMMPFTMEEAWLARHPSEDWSVHLELFPEVPADWLDAALAEKWEIVRDVRRVVTGALELERAQKRIGSSLQAHPTVHVSGEAVKAYEGLDAAEIFITSGATLTTDAAPAEAFRLPDVAGVAVVPGLAEGEKCERCWRQLPEVGHVPGHEAVCGRCAEAVETLQGAAA